MVTFQLGIFTVYSGYAKPYAFDDHNPVKEKIAPQEESNAWVENEIFGYWKQANEEMTRLFSSQFQLLLQRFSLFGQPGKTNLNLLRLH